MPHSRVVWEICVGLMGVCVGICVHALLARSVQKRLLRRRNDFERLNCRIVLR